MRRTLLVVAVSVAWGACHHEISPSTPQPPKAAPLSNRTASRAEAPATDDILAFLPIEAELVIRLDARRLLTSPLWAEYRPQLLAAVGAPLATFQARCGFDPMETIESVTVALRDTTQSDGVVVVRGWDRDLMLECLASHPSKTEQVINDHGILTVTGDGGQANTGTFVDRTTLVFDVGPTTSKDRLRAVLRSGAPLRRSPAFLAMFNEIDARATLWLLLNGRARQLAAAGIGSTTRGISAVVDVGAKLAAVAHVRMTSADQAAQLAAAAQTQLQQAQPFFDKLTAGSEGTVLTFACELSAAQLRTLAGLAASAYRRLGVKP